MTREVWGREAHEMEKFGGRGWVRRARMLITMDSEMYNRYLKY